MENTAKNNDVHKNKMQKLKENIDASIESASLERGSVPFLRLTDVTAPKPNR
jgi:hypothetical protein